MKIECAALTDPGKKRKRNEDRLLADSLLFAVADGMGGHRAGETASEIALRSIAAELSGICLDLEGEPPLQVEARLRRAVDRANDEVYSRAASDARYAGMGTTLTVAFVCGDHMLVGHVGDSRLYRLREGTLDQLTRDHSLVAEMVEGGKLSAAEAKKHPQRAIITRAIGTGKSVEVDIESQAIQAGDRYLLCTDGLSSLVPDDVIAAELGDAGGLDDACRRLIEAANERGGVDNITVVVFQAFDGREG